MILVAGGTGRLGGELTARLVSRGKEVRVLARRPPEQPPAEGVHFVSGDVRDPATLAPAVAGVDVVVSAVQGFVGPRGTTPAAVDRDGNAHLVDAVRSAGCELVLVSMVGAAADAPLELARMKYAAEQYAWASGVPTTVVRATAFLELWQALLGRTAGRSGRPVVLGHGQNPINFVSVHEVVAAVEQAVLDSSTRGRVIEVGGPVDLTMDELAATVLGPDGRAGRPRHVPPAVLRVLAATAGRLSPALARQLTAALVMDHADLTYVGRRLPGDADGAGSGFTGVNRPVQEAGMGTEDKMNNAGEDLKGKAKEAAGKLSDDERLEAEGKGDQSKADLKNAGENVKDAFKH